MTTNTNKLNHARCVIDIISATSKNGAGADTFYRSAESDTSDHDMTMSFCIFGKEVLQSYFGSQFLNSTLDLNARKFDFAATATSKCVDTAAEHILQILNVPYDAKELYHEAATCVEDYVASQCMNEPELCGLTKELMKPNWHAQ